MTLLLTLYWYFTAAIAVFLWLGALVRLVSPAPFLKAEARAAAQKPDPRRTVFGLLGAAPMYYLLLLGYRTIGLPDWLWAAVIGLTVVNSVSSLVQHEGEKGDVARTVVASGMLVTLYIAWAGLQTLRGGAM